MIQRRIQKVISLVSVAALSMSVLAGCGNTKQEQTKTVSQKIEETTGDVQKNPEDYSGTITMWGWDENYTNKTVEAFNKVYPNIKVEFTPVQSGDYLQKIQTSAVAGTELPDIIWAEIGWRGRAYALDLWEDLEAEPYNVDTSTLIEYTLPLISNDQGQIVGIEKTLCPGALAYRRDLAKEYLGTDDNNALSEMFKDWDSFIAKGKEIKEKSGGKITMFASLGDVERVLEGQNSKTIVNGNTIDITSGLQGTLQTMTLMRDAGIVDKLEQWSPAWSASYANGTSIFYPAASWSPQFVIKPNDPNELGRWGLMLPPGGGFNWGGTTLGISKTSNNKELAWQYIKWCTLTQEGARLIKEQLGFYPTLKEAYNDPTITSDKDPYFGGQDIGEFWFDSVMPSLQIRPLSKHDNVINDNMSLICKALVSDNTLDADKALQLFIDETRNKLPDAEVK